MSVVEEHLDIVQRAVRYTRLPETAAYDRDDMRGDGYLALINGVRTYRPELGASLRTHLHNMVRWGISHGYRSQFLVPSWALREQGRAPIRTVGQEIEEGDISLEDLLAGETDQGWDDQISLTEAIGRLPDEFQRIVRAYYYEDKSEREIAEALGMPRPTVGYKLRQAIEWLREAFAPTIALGDPRRVVAQVVLRDALRALDGRDQQIVTLALYHKLTHREIAERLTMSHTTVGYRLNRAYERLWEDIRTRIPCPQCDFRIPNACMARCARCGYYEPCGSEP